VDPSQDGIATRIRGVLVQLARYGVPARDEESHHAVTTEYLGLAISLPTQRIGGGTESDARPV